MIISLDTEATGVDLYHGAAPYLVTICDEEWNNTYWEWDVDPHTRKVKVVDSDLEEIVDFIVKSDKLILQNPKFDVTALMPLIKELLPIWPWEKTEDTLLAAHLLASNKAKDLNALALEWLGVDITQVEDDMEQAVKECRKIAEEKGWRIAKAGLPDMPSAKASQDKKNKDKRVWKFDCWLPRAIAKRKIAGWKKEWLTVTAAYANTDSSVTLGVWQQQQKAIEARGLEKIYRARLELLPVVYEMERTGVTYNRDRLNEISTSYATESAKANDTCLEIAENLNYCLELPKAGLNNSLKTFVFDVLKLEPIHVKKKKTNSPDLDKNALAHYKETLLPKSNAHRFVVNLGDKRKRDTAIGYMESYEKFSLPAVGEDGATLDEYLWRVLHPSLNSTGTDTLRFSCSGFNEQNISKQGMFEGDTKNIRYCFGPTPGREWWSLDAKNIELRIPAYESGEQELINLFEKPDEPPYYGSEHLLNFHTIYPDLWDKELAEVGLEKVGPHCKKKYASTWYQWCKNFGFATGYGAVEREDGQGTADRAAHRPGSQAKVKARFSKKEKLNQKYIDMANRLGYVETMPDRSVDPKRGYPLICTRNQWGRTKPTIPLNYHVQGTAMWWTCRAMVRCQQQLDEWRRDGVVDGRIVMQVHDELVFEFTAAGDPKKDPANSNLKYVQHLAKLMAKGGDDIGVPTPVGIEWNPVTWSEGVTIQ